MAKKHIIRMNEGTDEIYNLGWFEAETLDEALETLKGCYGTSPEEYPYADEGELAGTDGFFMEVTEERGAYLVGASLQDIHNAQEEADLMELYNKLVDPKVDFSSNGYWGRAALDKIFGKEKIFIIEIHNAGSGDPDDVHIRGAKDLRAAFIDIINQEAEGSTKGMDREDMEEWIGGYLGDYTRITEIVFSRELGYTQTQVKSQYIKEVFETLLNK